MLHLSPGITAYLTVCAALLGLVTGSFVNCGAYRCVRGGSVRKGRSACPHCGHTLSPAELVPLVSYLFLRGKCRWCAAPISLRYPAVEAVSALVFVALLVRFDLSASLLRWAVLCSLLLALSLVDLDTQTIPDGLLLAAAGWWLVTLPLVSSSPLAALGFGLLGGLGVAGPLLALVLLADKLLGRESMGGGDIKLLFVSGLYLGLPLNLLCLIVACLLGVIFGIVSRLSAREGERAPFPFGPAIAGAVVLTALFGARLLDWYLALFSL